MNHQLRDFLRSPLAIVSLTMLLGLVVLAAIGPVVWRDAADATNTDAMFAPVSAEHWFGADALGRDVLARVMVATRLSLVMALVATAVGALAGIVLGALPALGGKRIQRFASAVINMGLAFPVLLVAMLVVILLGTSKQTAVIALAITMVPSFARLAQTLSARVGGSEYLAAARLLGISPLRQFTRYVLPNIAEPIVVNVTLSIGAGLLALSSLSFLGVGVQAPEYDWGRLLNDGFDQVYTSPMAAIGPGLVIVLAGLAFGIFGEAVASSLRSKSGASIVRVDALGEPPRAVPDDADDSNAASAAAPSTPQPHTPEVLLDVCGLTVAFPSAAGWRTPVKDVSFRICAGEIVGLVGESGSGKSVTAMAIAGLADPSAVVSARRLTFRGQDLLSLSERQKRLVLSDMGVVFQDSLTALNPAMRVGAQLAEIPRIQQGKGHADSASAAVAALAGVEIADPERRAKQFPHEFSGGMRQRALIAMAEMSEPALLIADEPTTALDVTVQHAVLSLLRRECAQRGQAALVISHDIAVLGQLCQRIIVMYRGEIVEDFDTALLRTPQDLRHPYARALVESVPDMNTDKSVPLATISETMFGGEAA